MARFRALVVLCGVAFFAGLLLAPGTLRAQGGSQSMDPRTACAADVQRLCAGVPAGGGRILACLKQHQGLVSDGCKQAVLASMGRSTGVGSSAGGSAVGAGSPAASPVPASAGAAAGAGYSGNAASASTGGAGLAATPASGSGAGSPTDAAGKARSTSPQKSHGASTALAGSGERYFLMKKVSIVDQGQGKPAYDLLIPKDWQFKGWVNVGVAEGGCFGDWFSVVGVADSADNSIEMQMLPQFTWQYVSDAAGQQQMQKQNQADVKYGMKACPVRAPVRAEQFLRQDLAAKCGKCKNTTVVSAEAFPELDEITRHQLGLPPAAGGGNMGTTRVDAARIRIAFDDEKGQPAEGWMAAAIVVHTMPGGGYDWHAMNVLFFRAPKGKLDANDKLFKMMVSTIHPELEWQRQSNGVIASLYKKKQEELAKQAAIIAQFRQHVADVVNQVTANQMAGANQAANGQDQLVRGVQTFRDPATGKTMELSNQYDHAWLNGSNDYVMSGDPNYNPNGDLNGSWNQLEVVRPQP